MLDAHSQMILDEYRENLGCYEVVKGIVLEELKKITESLNMSVNSIEARVKKEKSLVGKLELKGYKYKTVLNLTDIVGARVVTFYEDEVDKIASLIGDKFTIDWDNSIDKRRIYNIDQFGYMSLHYICKIPKELYYDETKPLVNEIPFEIQIRTVLQHAWATIHHDTGYKTDVEIPKEYLRGLNRLAGILEMADEEFKRIRISIDEYRRKVKTIVSSGNFNDIELNGDSFKAYVEFGAFEKLNKEIAEINNMDIVTVSLDRFLAILKGFNFTTLSDVDNMIKEYSDKAYQYALVQFGVKDIDIISSSVGITCLCTVYILSKGYGEAGVNDFYTSLYGERKSNETLSKRAVEIAKKIGVIS